MDRKRKVAVAVTAVAASVIALGLWIGVQAVGPEAGAPDEPTIAPHVPTDAPASTPDPDYWDSDRMRDATPAPMPTVD